MVKVFTLGLSSIKGGSVPADGSMQTDANLNDYGYTNQNSAVLNMETPEKTEFHAEEVDDPVLVSQKAGAITVEWDIMNPAPETLVSFCGGTASKSVNTLTDNDQWEAPDTVPNIEMALKITPRQGFIVSIPRANVVGTVTGNFTSGEIVLLHVVATALTPTGTNAAKKLILKAQSAT
jgi:hypothetical protein